MKLLIIGPTDLRAGHPRNYKDIQIKDVSFPIPELLNAELVVYKSQYNVNVLDYRYAGSGTNLGWHSTIPTRPLHRLQQRMLSDILDNHKDWTWPSIQQWYDIVKCLMTREYPATDFRDFLNKLKKDYIAHKI